jgi:homoserine dehydrogenase
MPTASAVVSDLVGVALGTTLLQFRQLNVYFDQTPAAKVLPFEKLNSRYYLRLTAKDEPGVMAAVSTILGNQGISLSAISQHESLDAGASIPIVITTHVANEGAMQKAIGEINQLGTITAGCVCLRIIDQPKEFA